MKKYLRAFKTQAEYLEFTASTEFILDNVSSCREGDLVYYNSEQCGGQGIHRTISGETYCNGYDKYVYLYKQVSYDDGATWETTATTSSLVERNSEDCGYVPPTPPSDWDITAKFNVTNTGNLRIASVITGFSKIEIDGVEMSPRTGYDFRTTGEHTVKYKLNNTNISARSFEQCYGLTNVEIGNNVTSIEGAAFSNCYYLSSCTIGNSVTSIDSNAFEYCTRLTSIVIPDSVTSIGSAAFQYCSGLTTCAIGSGVTSISNSTFYNCSSLTSIDIPNSVTSISNSTFYNCSSLTSIDIPNSVTSIGQYAFDSCTSLTSITIEATVPPTLYNVNTFNNTNNCPIYVPCDSVDAYKSATNWSTYASRIQAIPGSCIQWDITAKFNVTSTSSPTKIASGTSSFNKIEIDGVVQPNVTTGYTFSTTGEHTVKYKLADPTSIGFYALAGCTSLTSCTIGSGVTSIGINAFRNCSSLTSIYIPNSVTSIGEASFYYCSGLTSVTIPSGITSIERSTFIGCTSLSDVNIPSGVTSIGISAFHWCSSLTSVTIPDSVTNINSSAFAQCTALSSCTIGSSVTSIGNNAFQYCSSLTRVTVEATTPPTLGYGVFENTNKCPIYVPCESVDTYKAAANWSTYASRIQAILGSC